MVYALPPEQSSIRKKKFSGTCTFSPDPKKQKKSLKGSTASSKIARKRPLCQIKQNKRQLACTEIDSNNRGWSQLERCSFRFHPVDSKWQNKACSKVGVQYQRPGRFWVWHTRLPSDMAKLPDSETDASRWQLSFPFNLNDHHRVTRRPSCS